MSTRRLALAALLLVGCAHGTSTQVGDGSEVGVGRIATDVERIRGLLRLRPLAATVLDAAGFKAALGARSRLDRKEVARERAVWVAFGFVPAGFDVGGAIRAVVGEQVVAFYDHRKHLLFLPRDMSKSGADSDWIVAHEIEHAMQDQHFGLDRKIAGDDRRLAWAALVEGDAMMVMTGLVAERSKIGLATAFARLGTFIRSMPPDALMKMGGHSPQISSAPPILRESLAFPYLGALDLLAGVHRAGTFALVDQMFAHPPISTEQVMHPDKYLAGEQPIHVEDPLVPAGTHKLQSETLGELRTRILMSDCLSFHRAQALATGWGGDRYTVGERKDGGLVLLWSTAWDDEPHAVAFQEGLLAYQRCWKEPPAGVAPSISNDAAVVREGTRVVFVRGLSKAEADLAARRMLQQPIATVASIRPLPIAQLPPAPAETDELLSRQPPRLVDGHFVAPMFGLELDLPKGATGTVKAGTPQLSVKRSAPTTLGGMVSFLPTAPTPAVTTKIFEMIESSAGAMVAADAKLKTLSESEVDLGWSKALQHTWVVDSNRGVRVYLLPWCDGKAMVMVLNAWSDQGTEIELTEWVRSFARTTGQPPICAP